MTFSEYSRIMEIEEAKADNVMADIDYMIESANATHKLNLADLDFKFESEDYDMSAMTQMYTEEAETFTDKLKAIWDKFFKWLQGVISAMFNLKPNEETVKKAEEASPEGVKVPVDVKKVDKAMNEMSPLLTKAYAKRLMKDVDMISRKGVKVNLNIKQSGSVNTYEHSSAIGGLAKAMTKLFLACTVPAASVIGATEAAKHMGLSLDFNKKIHAFMEDLKEEAKGVCTEFITPFRDLATCLMSYSKGLNSTITSAAEKGEEKIEQIGATVAKGLDKAANTASAAKAKVTKGVEQVTNAANTAKTAVTNSKVGHTLVDIGRGLKDGLKEGLHGDTGTHKPSSDKGKKGKATMDSTSSDFADDTVYSQFFESTDMMPKSDTSYFLKSDDERIDDMLKILDSM